MPKCNQFGCKRTGSEIAYLVLDQEDKSIRGEFCGEHGEPVYKQGIANFIIEKIPDANSVEDRPLVTKPKPVEWASALEATKPKEKGETPMAAQMAPSDAVYDEPPDSKEEVFNEDPAQLAYEQREERKVLAEEISSNFRWHIGNKQVFDVQTTLRGDYSTEAFRRYAKRLLGDMEFLISAGGRGTVRYAPGIEMAVSPPISERVDGTPAPSGNGKPAPGNTPPASRPTGNQPAAEQGGQQFQPGQTGQFVATKMEIFPQPKGTTQVKFYTQGAQKSAYTFSRKPINILPYFEESGNAWGVEHFEKAGEFTVSYLIKWVVTENPMPQGGYYRDITSLTPA